MIELSDPQFQIVEKGQKGLVKLSYTNTWYRKTLLLLGVNRMILSRGSKARKLTPFLFILGFMIMFAASFYLVGTIEESSLPTDIRLIGIIMYMAILFDFTFAVGRCSAESGVNIGNLSKLPVSMRFLVGFLVLENIVGFKSLIYLGFALAVSIRVFKVSCAGGIAALLLFSAFFLFLEVWVSVMVLLLGKTFIKNKAIYPILLIVLLLPVYLSQFGIIDSVKFAELATSGVLGIVGKGIGFALDGQWHEVGIVVLQIVSFAAIGMIAGVVILKKKEILAY